MKTNIQVRSPGSRGPGLGSRQQPTRNTVESRGDIVGPSSPAARFGHRLAGISAEAPGGPLRVGPSDDRYEREADRVAERIVAETQTPGAGTAESVSVTPLATPPTAAGSVQRASYDSHAGGSVAPGLATQIHAAKRQGGQPLPLRLRAPAERVLRADLSRVRIHQDAGSQRLAQAVGATAFATGQDIFLGPGAPDASTPSGLGIVAHELTHTVQQQGSAAGPGGGVIQRWPPEWLKRLFCCIPSRAADTSTSDAPPPLPAAQGHQRIPDELRSIPNHHFNLPPAPASSSSSPSSAPSSSSSQSPVTVGSAPQKPKKKPPKEVPPDPTNVGAEWHERQQRGPPALSRPQEEIVYAGLAAAPLPEGHDVIPQSGQDASTAQSSTAEAERTAKNIRKKYDFRK